MREIECCACRKGRKGSRNCLHLRYVIMSRAPCGQRYYYAGRMGSGKIVYMMEIGHAKGYEIEKAARDDLELIRGLGLKEHYIGHGCGDEVEKENYTARCLFAR